MKILTRIYEPYNCYRCGSDSAEPCGDEFVTEENEKYLLFFKCEDCGAEATEEYVFSKRYTEDDQNK